MGEIPGDRAGSTVADHPAPAYHKSSHDPSTQGTHVIIVGVRGASVQEPFYSRSIASLVLARKFVVGRRRCMARALY
jgi:hypothetical protein